MPKLNYYPEFYGYVKGLGVLRRNSVTGEVTDQYGRYVTSDRARHLMPLSALISDIKADNRKSRRMARRLTR